ncbi:hypothetical protein NDU88_000164 [Pleurodeles waltl]|uniref:Uncharacterized protein n=1 Tax=Pleurodeles waltl TaxID=8319 RepID=A0AAV7TE67_PLEWA|nr:hypothetical protein NDU88_000164 [Pleurodeles waltl]
MRECDSLQPRQPTGRLVVAAGGSTRDPPTAVTRHPVTRQQPQQWETPLKDPKFPLWCCDVTRVCGEAGPALEHHPNKQARLVAESVRALPRAVPRCSPDPPEPSGFPSGFPGLPGSGDLHRLVIPGDDPILLGLESP